jgi:hypothetical protein
VGVVRIIDIPWRLVSRDKVYVLCVCVCVCVCVDVCVCVCVFFFCVHVGRWWV